MTNTLVFLIFVVYDLFFFNKTFVVYRVSCRCVVLGFFMSTFHECQSPKMRHLEPKGCKWQFFISTEFSLKFWCVSNFSDNTFTKIMSYFMFDVWYRVYIKVFYEFYFTVYKLLYIRGTILLHLCLFSIEFFVINLSWEKLKELWGNIFWRSVSVANSW